MRALTRALAAVSVLAAAAFAPAQQAGWAEKMFKDGTTHDFGSVARGAQLHKRFTVTNIYAVRMEITDIQTSCHCTTAAASKRVLEPRETAHLDVTVDARKFSGPKTFTVRVRVGPDFVSQAELKVSANSRQDIVFNPGEVNFGTVPKGTAASQTVDVEYAGALEWKVSEVTVPKDAPYEASLKEAYRRPGQVGYQLSVALKPTAGVGAIKDYVYLKTNDPQSPLVPVLVEANVQTALSVSPANFALGAVKANEALTRRVVVRGTKPVKVLKVEGLDKEVALGAELPAAAAAVHTVTFKIQPAAAGAFKREVKILTDAQPEPLVVVIEGTVTP